jgi:DNA-binding FrmR family transcriptional regulator
MSGSLEWAMEAAKLCVNESCLAHERIGELRARLSRLEGHVRAINRMLEEGRDCQSLLLQVSAVKAALNQVTVKLLEGYVEGCMRGDHAAAGEPQEQLKSALALALKFS